MKVFYTDNDALLELLSEKGITPKCDSDMKMLVTDEEAGRIPAIVEQFAPAATGDYTIEDAPIYSVVSKITGHAVAGPFATRKEAEEYLNEDWVRLLITSPTDEAYLDLKSFM